MVDADAIVRRLYDDPAIRMRIARIFRPAVVTEPGGRLDRARIAEIVFRDAPKLEALTRAVHPAVFREIRREIRGAKDGILVLDVPLLLETGLDRECDRLVYVSAPERVRLERLRRDRGVSRAEAARRARFQKPLAEKRRRADAIVDNRGTRASVRRQVSRLWRELEARKPVPRTDAYPSRKRRTRET